MEISEELLKDCHEFYEDYEFLFNLYKVIGTMLIIMPFIKIISNLTDF